ncbi:hypothetical protein GCM10022220_47510 [Actinocatenispora rupis]|uniref:Uncharacterized protein n=1 Tax=Actinocatenispora rupis TaxID=519421 RepID=A0A8J3NAU8_9ACTN|nr:hypothetical protein Aru02nite_33600 [Actinocatenispora rupis]
MHGVLPFGRARRVAALPAVRYVDRQTVTTRGSTHVRATFMGLTSSRGVTAVGTVPQRGRSAHVFSGRPGTAVARDGVPCGGHESVDGGTSRVPIGARAGDLITMRDLVLTSCIFPVATPCLPASA